MLGAVESCVVALLALAAELGLSALVLGARIGWLPFVGGHALVLGLIGLWTYWLYRRDEALHIALLLALSVALMGPVGPAGVLLCLALYAWFSRDATRFEDWYASLFPEEARDQAMELYDLIASGREGADEHQSVTSFSDVLAFGTSDQKRAVITLLSRNWRPTFAPTLLQALADKDSAIRVQAATAASEIESAFLDRAMRLLRASSEAPDNADLHLNLARHYDDYAFSGLLDPAREEDARTQALMYYRRVLTLDASLTDAWIAVGRLLLRLGRTNEASDWFARAIESGQTASQIVDWRLESLFRLGDYDGLRRLATVRVRDFGAEPTPDEPRIADAVRLWSGQRRPMVQP